MKTLLRILFIVLFSYTTVTSAIAQGPRNALRFDGYDDYVYFDRNNRGITNEVTVEAWVKTTATKLQLVTAKYDRDAELGYQLVMRDGKAAFSGRDGSGVYRISGYSPRIINDGKWHHLAGVCKNGIWSIYIDGVLESSFESGNIAVNLASNAPFTVGNYFMVNYDFFQGEVDELKVWKKGLTEEEIRTGMCQKANEKDPNLVVYLKFDEGAGTTVKDHSSYGINGSFRNMSAATAWTVSGAAIGDRSVYRYDSKWDTPLELETNIANFSVSRADPTIKGFHVYQIGSAPSQTNGLPNPGAIKEYYGVFKVGAPDKKYKVRLDQFSLACGGKLYNRANNAVNSWAQVADTTHAGGITYHTTDSQGEYAALGNSSSTIRIDGPGTICRGSSATLSVTPGIGTVLWNTGATTNSIQVSQAGTYSVVVTEEGCERSGSITLQESDVPVFSLGPDKSLCFGETQTLSAPVGFTYRWSTGATSRTIEVGTTGDYWVDVTSEAGCTSRDEVTVVINPQPNIAVPQELSACHGEQVTVDATMPGASYLWSTGQTTATVQVAAPTTLSVSITVLDCTYTREITVNSDECPIIPNIITPNGDGKNDTFVLKGIDINQVEIEIFNRWGTSVYKRITYDNKWASTVTGMYYYHIKSKQTGKVYKGWVEVVL